MTDRRAAGSLVLRLIDRAHGQCEAFESGSNPNQPIGGAGGFCHSDDLSWQRVGNLGLLAGLEAYAAKLLSHRFRCA